ncbi:MAG: class I SAM-dependent methyltransferase [Methylovirgula sp.]|jgi:hypothetical protein
MEELKPKAWSPSYQVNVDLNIPVSISKYHQGIYYCHYLNQIHLVCKPSGYLEIGVFEGVTLSLARCRAVAVDPRFQIRVDPLGQRPETYLFQMTSDDFFARHNLKTFLPDGVDLAFLDGMHQFEYLLRDFMNTEKYSHKGTIVTLHDCHPVNTEIANREPTFERRSDPATRTWWAGDVWKLLPILRDFRPDLDVTILDCPPTAFAVVRGLDSGSTVLADAYDEIVEKYRDVTLDAFGIERLREEFPTTDSRGVFEPGAMTEFLLRR